MTSSLIRKDGNVLRVLPNFHVVGTLLWMVLSIAAIVCGILHCRANAYNYLCKCDSRSNACTLTSTLGDVQPMRIDRGDIADVRVVRLGKQGEVVDTNGMRQRHASRLGSTLQIVYRRRAEQRIDAQSGRALFGAEHEPELQGTQAELLFPPMDMGGNMRLAKSGKRRIDEFVDGRSDDAKVSSGRVVTALGLMGILGGFFSALLACFIGVWADAPSKRRKRRD